MAGNDDPGRVPAGPAQGGRSQVDERAAVARLAPESPLMFAWARRALREIAGADAARFLVGSTAPGSRSVLPGEGEWLVVHEPADGTPGTPGTTAAYPAARAAVADAAARVLVDSGVRVTSGILESAGIIRRDPRDGRPLWKLGEAGERIKERGADGSRAGGPGVPIGSLEGRRLGYFACAPRPPGGHGAFAGVHEIFELAVRSMLPPDPEDGSATGADLPEGTELDGFGGTDQVYLFTPETPFIRRGLWGRPTWHEHRRYRVHRPFRAYPGFPVADAIFPATGGRPPEVQGQGYYLVDTVADLVRGGELAVTTGAAGRDGAAWR